MQDDQKAPEARMENQSPHVRWADVDQTVHVVVRRKYGDVELEYGLTRRYIPENFDELTKAFEEVREVVETQLELALKNRPELMPNATKSPEFRDGAIVFCTKVRKENVNGKVRLRLLGGEFSTHGIAAYPEFYGALEVNEDTIPYGDNPYDKHVLIQLDAHGNPKRALKVVSQPS